MRLIAEGLSHRFPTQDYLFSDLSFDLNRGDLVCLSGPSGSGKSTLMSIIAGWTTPTAGTIYSEGSVKTAWIFQNPHGLANRTALDHICLPLLAEGQKRSDAEGEARRLAQLFGLLSVLDRRYRHLSGGEAQRLALARAVASRPSLILADEPTAQLDPNSAQAVSDVLDHLSEEGAIVVIATHDARVRDRCIRHIDLGKT